jgi:hypothetical protein
MLARVVGKINSKGKYLSFLEFSQKKRFDRRFVRILVTYWDSSEDPLTALLSFPLESWYVRGMARKMKYSTVTFGVVPISDTRWGAVGQKEKAVKQHSAGRRN